MSTLEKTAFTIGFSFIVFALTLNLTPKETVCLAGYTVWCVAIFIARIFDVIEDRKLDREYGNEK